MAKDKPKGKTKVKMKVSTKMNADGLTYLQSQFVKFYKGNGTEACRLAGYQGSANVLAKQAHDLLRKPKIKKALALRDKKDEVQNTAIASRNAIQEFFTKVMDNKFVQKVVIGQGKNAMIAEVDILMKDRVAAATALARTKGMFITQHGLTDADGNPVDELEIEVEIDMNK